MFDPPISPATAEARERAKAECRRQETKTKPKTLIVDRFVEPCPVSLEEGGILRKEKEEEGMPSSPT